MIALTNEVLKKYIDKNFNLAAYRKRFCYNEIKNIFMTPHNQKVISLYGLRRTGKTVIMQQLMQDIKEYDKMCFIQCQYSDDMMDLRSAIEDNDKCDYIFIDEATKLDNFINTASVLSDIYATAGKHIIMAGTDSLGFEIASKDELFDRSHLIHTTYIPFKEYNYLLGKSLDDYIMYGGTLTPDGTFYNQEICDQYTNSAIAENIQHSLENIGRGGKFGPLLSFYANDELTTFLNKIIELHNRTFLAKTINRRFKSHDIGSLKDFIAKKAVNQKLIIEKLRSSELLQQLMEVLKIKEPLINTADAKAIEAAKKWLEILDVIYRLPASKHQEDIQNEEVIFTQPGLRYCQVTAAMELIKRSSVLSEFPYEVRNELCQKLDADVKGQLLEDIIFYQLAKEQDFANNFIIDKFSDGFREFDITLMSKKNEGSYVIEIKHSDRVVEAQTRYLNDNDFCAKYEEQTGSPIICKMVIYMGETLSESLYGVNYVNAEDFLKAPFNCLDKLHERGQSRVMVKEIADEISKFPNHLAMADNIKTVGQRIIFPHSSMQKAEDDSLLNR